jgi:hypothetical protein
MMGVKRRLAGLSAIGVAVALTAVAGASPASAAITGPPNPPLLPNTTIAGAVTLPTDTPAALLTVPAAQLQGPGAHTEATNTYASSTPVVTATPSGCILITCTGSSVAMSYNLDPTGLPAAPGVYTLTVCAVTCTVPSLLGDTSPFVVYGAAPAPDSAATGIAASIAPGASGAIDIKGDGFAKLESMSIVAPAPHDTQVTFTEDNATSSKTELKGNLAVGAAVLPGVYDVVVTATDNQAGICTQCLSVTGTSPVGAPAPVTDLSATATTATTGNASWSASAGATSYNIFVSETSTSSTDGGITATVANSGAGTTATISGLSSGTTYYVSVVAHNSSGDSTPTVTTMTTPEPTTLTLAASKNKIINGDAVKLTGKLSKGADEGIAHRTIELLAKPDTSHTVVAGQDNTNSSGEYAFSVKPSENTRYFAYFPGTDGSGSVPGESLSVSSPQRVKVAPLVTATPKFTSSPHNSPFVVTGKVAPNEAGTKVRLVTVGAAKHRIATATLSSTSHYKFSTPRPTKKGSYKFQVLIKHIAGHAKGASKVFKADRT